MLHGRVEGERVLNDDVLFRDEGAQILTKAAS